MNWLTYRKAVLRDRPSFYTTISSAPSSQRDLTNKSTNSSIFGTHTRPASFFGGLAVKFPGVNANNGMDWGNQGQFNIGDTWSCEVWYKPGGVAAPSVEQVIVCKGNSGGNGAYGLFWNSTDQRLVLQRPEISNLAFSSTGSVVANVWYHLVGTKSGTSIKAYVNGKDATVAGTNSTCNNSTRGLGIGLHENSTGTGYIKESIGTHADTVVYNYVLSPAQILRHYHAGRFGHI